MSWPYFRENTGTNAALFVMFLWFITCDYSWLIKKWPWDITLVAFFFITFLPHLLTGNLQYGSPGPSVILKWIPLFLFGILVNYYYLYFKQNYVLLGRIALTATLCYTVGSIQSFLVLQRYPWAARILATTDTAAKEVYSGLGVGGFGFVYAGLFLAVSVTFLIRSPNNTKGIRVLAVLAFAAIALLLLKASYTISIILFFTGVLMVILPIKKKASALSLFVFVFLLVFLSFSRDELGRLVLRFSEIFHRNEIVASKFRDLASWFLGQGRTFETGYRLNLYESSFITFLDNPIFGVYGPSPNPGQIGGHSGWFDLLAFYGLFTTIPFVLAIYFNFRKHHRFFKGNSYSKYLLTCQLLFVILAIINPIFYIYEIGFMMFLILPSLPFLPYAFSKHSALKKSERGSR